MEREGSLQGLLDGPENKPRSASINSGRPQPVHRADQENNDLMCYVCQRLIYQAKMLTCPNEHMLCGACIPAKRICPFDSAAFLDVKEPSMAALRALSNVLVYCIFKEAGCDWRGPNCQFQEHTRTSCGVVRVACKHLECPLSKPDTEAKWPKRSEWDKHTRDCPHQRLSCTHCNVQYTLIEKPLHAKCGVGICEYCGEEGIPTDMLEVHQTGCLDTIVACPLQRQGCPFVGKRKEVFKHTSAEATSYRHMALLAAKLDAIEMSRPPFSMTMVWKIKKFKRIKMYELKSNEVSFAGMQWWIQLYPNGNYVENKEFVSLFLYSSCAKNTTMTVEYELSVSNKRIKKKDEWTFFGDTQKQANRGWSKFLNRDKLKEEGYLEDGALIVECTIVYRSCSSSLITAQANKT